MLDIIAIVGTVLDPAGVSFFVATEVCCFTAPPNGSLA
jgi:hypothetical protein